MGCVAPLRRGGRRNPSVPSRCGSPLLLLTCALLMTSSHSEGQRAGLSGVRDAIHDAQVPRLARAAARDHRRAQRRLGHGLRFVCQHRVAAYKPRRRPERPSPAGWAGPSTITAPAHVPPGCLAPPCPCRCFDRCLCTHSPTRPPGPACTRALCMPHLTR